MTNAPPKPESGESVTEPIARAAYLAMPTPRSLHRLALELARQYPKVPHEKTFKNWSKKHGWVRLAAEHDARVATKAADILVTKQARTAAQRAELLIEQAEEMMVSAVNGARSGDGDPAQLAKAAVTVMEFAEILAGGKPVEGSLLKDDAGEAEAKEHAERVRQMIAKARGTVVNLNGSLNGKAANGHGGNGHGEPTEH